MAGPGRYGKPDHRHCEADFCHLDYAGLLGKDEKPCVAKRVSIWDFFDSPDIHKPHTILHRENYPYWTVRTSDGKRSESFYYASEDFGEKFPEAFVKALEQQNWPKPYVRDDLNQDEDEGEREPEIDPDGAFTDMTINGFRENVLCVCGHRNGLHAFLDPYGCTSCHTCKTFRPKWKKK